MIKQIKLIGIFALVACTLITAPAQAQVEPYIGEIRYVGFNFCPVGWIAADGQVLSISQNTALFSLFGTTYGGDGRTTFGVPDLRGRVALHQGQGPGLSDRSWGEKDGAEEVTLTTNQIPSHTHQLVGTTDRANTSDASGNVLAKSGSYNDGGPAANLASASVGNTGGSQAHENMPPFTTVRACVAITGIFPSRN